MAAKNSIANAGDRMDIALQATWQIHGLFEGLIAQSAPLSEMPEHLEQAAVVRAIGIRGRRLIGAALSMLGDDLASLDDARDVVIDGSEPAGAPNA